MKPTRTLLCLAILALAPLAAGCVATPPVPTAAQAVAPPTVAPAAAQPTPQPDPAPLPQPGLYIQPEQLWGIEVPEALPRVEARDSRLTVLSGAEQGTVLVVDSYLGAAGEHGNTGEGLRSRAHDVVAQLFGADVPTDNIEPADYRWQTGIAFERGGAVKGEACYAQPGRDGGDYRVYGVILAYPPASEATARPLLEAARDTFRPAAALALQVPAGSEPLWAVYSYGLRSFGIDLPAGHFLAIFGRSDAGWQEHARLSLELPDYVDPGSVRQVQVEPTRVWLTVEGGVGAHGGTFQLLSYGGGALEVVVEGTSSSPGAGAVQDLDGDGTADVMLDETENYVFCYACGVRYPRFRVLRWDGAHFVEAGLAPPGPSLPAEVREPLGRAVEMAQAGLWLDARAAARQVPPTADPTAAWDLGLIRLHADAFSGLAREAPYPLLGHLFYGDYAAVLDLMRACTPQEVFDPAGPLVAGTVAEGWQAELSSWVLSVTTKALEARPDLAAAYYLRGWAACLADPSSPQARADVAQAAQMEPAERLYAEALAYLER